MLDGILSVDKPRGMTSHDAVEIVRRVSGIRAVGHTGTLDPDANGILLLCLGRATKFARIFEALEKTYWAVLQLGVCTDTQDAAGKVVRIRAVPAALSRRDVESVLPKFTGCLKQTPPMYSALKQGGQRLYRLARQGYVIDRPAREILCGGGCNCWRCGEQKQRWPLRVPKEPMSAHWVKMSAWHWVMARM